jgi:hypothetical protein
MAVRIFIPLDYFSSKNRELLGDKPIVAIAARPRKIRMRFYVFAEIGKL